MISCIVCKENAKCVKDKESVRKMNIQGTINKLLIGIKQKGKNVKLDTKMYYSERANKYITKYLFYEKQKVENSDGEETEKWVEIDSCYGKVKLLKAIVNYYKKIEGEANE